MPSKTLTPQEFEDQYLGRSHERPKREDMEVGAKRIAMQRVLEEQRDAFRLGEGFKERVQEFYDASFDRAFEDIVLEGDLSQADFSTARLAFAKRFRSQNIFWGSIIKNDETEAVIEAQVARIALPEGELEIVPHEVETEIIIGGVITLDTIGCLRDKTDSGQMNSCINLKPWPTVALCIKPLSWKLAAINLAGGISRLQFLDQKSDANLNKEMKMFLQELTAVEVQIDLADHLSNGIFSDQIRRTLQSDLGADNPDQFISKARTKEWSRALTDSSFGRVNPPAGEGEELMRSWLCRVAALRYFAHKQAGGNTAHPQLKFSEFAELYSKYSREFEVYPQ